MNNNNVPAWKKYHLDPEYDPQSDAYDRIDLYLKMGAISSNILDEYWPIKIFTFFNSIRCKFNGDFTGFYHVTALQNVNSIKTYGLYSSKYLKESRLKNITIQTYGSSCFNSFNYDNSISNNDEFIHLSFCRDHPIGLVIKDTTSQPAIVLPIDSSVVALKGVKFTIGSHVSPANKPRELIEIDKIDFNNIKTPINCLRRPSDAYNMHLSELLVPNYIPNIFIGRPFLF